MATPDRRVVAWGPDAHDGHLLEQASREPWSLGPTLTRRLSVTAELNGVVPWLVSTGALRTRCCVETHVPGVRGFGSRKQLGVSVTSHPILTSM